MLHLDTAEIAPADRFEVVHDLLREASKADRVELERDRLRAQVVVTQLGSATIFNTDSSSMRLVRRSRVSRNAQDDMIAIGLQSGGIGRMDSCGVQRLVRPGDIVVTDVTRPYDWSWEGDGACGSLQVPRALTGLSVDAARSAALNMRPTPLAKLLGRHLVSVLGDVDAISRSAGAQVVADMTLQLASAVLIEAAAGACGERAMAEAAETTLPAQVRAYVGQNLRDPGLTADRIAAALAISRRHLYRVCGEAGMSIEQQIISRRLALAHTELTAPALRGRSVADIAHSVGFRDVDHFRRRFKQAYGLTPHECREQAHAARRRQEPPRPRETGPAGGH